MGCFGMLVFAISAIFIIQPNPSTAQRFLNIFCFVPYTANTTYDNNLNLLLSSMSNTTMRNNTKFYADTVGRDPDTIFAILQCRVDLNSQACKNCIETAASYIKTRCPNMKEVVIWYEECTFHCSYNVIRSTMVMEPKICDSNATDVTDPSVFTPKLNELMGGLTKAAGNSTNMFAVGVTNVTNSQRIYGLVQCYQDISSESCERCLTVSINQLPTCLEKKISGKILRPSCVLWFEPVKFFPYNDSLFSPTNMNIHSDRIIHRDLKCSNVLIDGQMLPKISDFRMARLVEVDHTQGSTNKVVGTFGYMAPEYAMHGHFSVKTDVFSFGVVVLEIITGQKNNSFFRGGHEQDLLSYAWKHWQEGTALELIEPTLQEYPSEVMRCLHMGLLCVQEDVGRRPTMTDVVLMLSGSFDIPLPSTPAIFAKTTERDGQ